MAAVSRDMAAVAEPGSISGTRSTLAIAKAETPSVRTTAAISLFT
jgi:hypothetical protein